MNGAAAPPPPVGLAGVVRFIGLSGAGWLFDLALFVALTSALGVASGVSNAVSGVTAASIVFALSNRMVFGASNTGLGRKVAVFALYQGVLILLASVAVSQTHEGLLRIAPHVAPGVDPALLPVAAKCLVTPFTLAANFVVGRTIAHILEKPA